MTRAPTVGGTRRCDPTSSPEATRLVAEQAKRHPPADRQNYFFFSMCFVCRRRRGLYFDSSSLLVPGFFISV